MTFLMHWKLPKIQNVVGLRMTKETPEEILQRLRSKTSEEQAKQRVSTELKQLFPQTRTRKKSKKEVFFKRKLEKHQTGHTFLL